MGFVSVRLVLVGPPRAVWVVLLRCSAFVLLPALPYRLEVLAPVGHGFTCPLPWSLGPLSCGRVLLVLGLRARTDNVLDSTNCALDTFWLKGYI
jgi:hypothetical protein